MEILKILTLRGPNFWSRRPALEAWVDLQELKDSPSNTLPGFSDRLSAWLPTLIEHRCSIGERGGFLQRLREGTWPGHILEHVTLELQSLAGTPVGFGKARETSTEGIYKVVVRYEEEELGKACLHAARELVLAAIHDHPFDVAGEVNRLRALAERLRPGPGTAGLAAAAKARGIPCRRLEAGGLQLGHGSRQRRIGPEEGEAIAGPDATVEALFPPGESGRIPIACVTGTNGKTTVTRLVHHLLRATGKVVGMACTDGVYLDGDRLERGDAGPRGASALLLDPRLEAAVFEAGRGGILREGLGFDACDVAVVTNLGECDHLGQHWIDAPEQMFTVKRCGVDVVLPTGAAVLKADDPLVASMAELSAGSVVFFALDPEHPVMARHRAAGKRTAFVRAGQLVLAEGDLATPLLDVAAVPMTCGGRVPFQVENALAGAAAAWSLGLPFGSIRAGLAAFGASDLPGRFERFEAGGRTALVDDCHNPSALAALLQALEQFPSSARSAVYSAGHGRRDADLLRQGELLGAGFDRVVLCDDPSATDRAPGAARALLRRGLASGARAREVLEIADHREAVQAALRAARPGELVVVQTEDLDLEPTLDVVRGWVASNAGEEGTTPRKSGGAER